MEIKRLREFKAEELNMGIIIERKNIEIESKLNYLLNCVFTY